MSLDYSDKYIVSTKDEEKSVTDGGFYFLLALQAAVCFVSNGALPSVQTYVEHTNINDTYLRTST